eukprot:TRINITY_DN1788_c0_g1::TRINITY_DN1788_c0_g1_i1::g.25047::m.25047 TRINITY_DN1788_c0_g1::TRINITY_DN1788_c0_g1_i1::g.25047  ORF type:complete len:989 (-),score=311.70,sp/Q9SV21/COPB1_ARATH/46.74/0.0,Adaptin_N/PF01602.15/1.1e-87,Coatomer_b_Cpla/PF14806.1/1.8e+03,Coatomer_b_Cpla/PF14806.1/2.1e-53,Coatamer_beta_C/PF07718.7/1.9e-46,HEAT_2/PF13646.1/1.5e+04,HEAT_2/PF13646.1/0.0044,HEAT_2/PF13646.1/0.037,HEAT_2/PF13646.1/4.6e+02,HEAT_2/PF13646.1/8.1e+02,HEAT_2/PF13646.1/1.5e+04,HEAT/PF02985.17/1.4e+03,HEA
MERCPLLVPTDKIGPWTVPDLRAQLQNSDVLQKTAAVKKTIQLLLSGEQIPGITMMIIRDVLPFADHNLKKLCLHFFEIIPKRDPSGKLLPEMILVCNQLMNDLKHPNEYVRGCTLRFVSKLEEAEVLEPLVVPIKANLEHRHSYVRRNAVLAIHAIYRQFEHLLPDAPQLVEKFLQGESDLSAKRNAFLMLFQCDKERAGNYLTSILGQVSQLGEIFQVVVLEAIRHFCRQNPMERAKYVRVIHDLLQAESSSIVYEAASTLVSLTSVPTAIRSAANAYCRLLASESDNNVKMIVLDRLVELKTNHKAVLQEMLMDIMRALSLPNMDIRNKVLGLTLDMVTARTIDGVTQMLKKELLRTQDSDSETGDYRVALIQAIHRCAVRFPEVASSVLGQVLDLLTDPAGAAVVEIVNFLREIVEIYPALRPEIVRRTLIIIGQIKYARIQRSLVWILGEYSESVDEILSAFATFQTLLANLPTDPDAAKVELAATTPTSGSSTPAAPTRTSPHVLADGTYATQGAAATKTSPTVSGTSEVSSTDDGECMKGNPPFRGKTFRECIIAGDFFLAIAFSCAMTKLVLRLESFSGFDAEKFNNIQAHAMLWICNIIRMGKNGAAGQPLDELSLARLMTCIRVISAAGTNEEDPEVKRTFLQLCRATILEMIQEKRAEDEKEAREKQKESQTRVDQQINFSLLKTKRGADLGLLQDDSQNYLKGEGGGDSRLDLNRIVQLTGFADPLYVEALMTVHQYDIMLDVLVLNRTQDTLQNVSLELATLGDLKICERSHGFAAAPGDAKRLKVNIKVSSTEMGVVFGNILYETAGAAATKGTDHNYVTLNDIHLDIVDYIRPSSCTDVNFRIMWAEFEWENKIAINSNYTDPVEFVRHMMACTNMRCLNTECLEPTACPFISANLYAKSIFDEDVLANVSVDQIAPDQKVSGYIRIRSKTQGIALSLGDKMTLSMRKAE